VLDHRRGADGEIGAIFLDRSQVLFEAGAIVDPDTARFEPFAVGSDQGVRGQAVPT
jgi:hypothetical protein